MVDIADLAAELTEETITRAIVGARAGILAGIAGECEQCEWWMPRLVDGRCAFCRDGRPRPPDWEPPPRPDAVPVNHSEEIAAMPAKSIQLPAYAEAAIAAIEQHAAASDTTLGHAAAILIERGLNVVDASPVPIALEDIHLDALLNEVRRRFEIIDLNAVNELRDALARADAAEGKLAAAKALFA